MMITRQELERKEIETFAPYACCSINSKGREFLEEPAPFRTEFQRDRDRIIHSAAFRRLEYKTQVFVNHEGDHYRTRLTHTLEVAQIARTVSRSLRLNEDLTEALVLAHDLGHTPFGHAGERTMAQLMGPHGGFEHNSQSLRVVEKLEHRYPQFSGLNLCFEVREGIVKHSPQWKKEKIPSYLQPEEQPTLEAQLIDWVDEIAYINHDLDDGLSSKLLDYENLFSSVSLWKEAFLQVRKQFPQHSSTELKYVTISKMISLLVHDLVSQSFQFLSQNQIESWEKVRKFGKGLIGFSSSIDQEKNELKKFLWDFLYTNHRVIRMEEKARRILQDLFSTYIERPEQLPKKFLLRSKKEPLPRVVCDYIAGMTDRFAVEEHSKLFDPRTRV